VSKCQRKSKKCFASLKKGEGESNQAARPRSKQARSKKQEAEAEEEEEDEEDEAITHRKSYTQQVSKCRRKSKKVKQV